MAKTLCGMGHRMDDPPKAHKPRDECNITPLRRPGSPDSLRNGLRRLQYGASVAYPVATI